jgi:hypothetical protein
MRFSGQRSGAVRDAVGAQLKERLDRRFERWNEHGRCTAVRVCMALVVGLLGGTAPALGQDDVAPPRVNIETLVPYAETAEILPAIREECGLGTKLSRKVAKRAGERGIEIVQVGNLGEATHGRVLSMRITDALAAGGFLSAKSLTVSGVLKGEGKTVGTFVARRFARAGFFSLSRSDCAVLSKAASALARDISKFLAKPRMDARLGDAR